MSRSPTGWAVVRLGDVADTALGKMLDTGVVRGHSKVPYLRNVNVQWGHIDTADLRTMELADAEVGRFSVKTGDLLICEGGEIGRAAIWTRSGESIAYQKALHRVRSRGSLHLPYLRYLMEAYATNGTLEHHSTGSTIAHLPQERLRSLPVPLPSLAEQQRIVDILEDHLSRLDAAEDSVRAARRKADILSDHALAGLYREVDGEAVRLGDVVRMGSGGTPSSRTEKYYKGGTIPWINSGDLKDAVLNSVPLAITEAGLAASSAKWVPTGSVLVAMYGATIGRLAITSFPATTNQAIAHMVPKEQLNRDYLFWFLRSQRARLVGVGKGGAQPNISQTILRDWTLKLPPLAAQQKIVQESTRWADGTDRLAKKESHLSREVASLRRSLLSSAFSGRLTGRLHEREVYDEAAAK